MKPIPKAALWLIAYVMAYCSACVYCTHIASEEATNRAITQLAAPVQKKTPQHMSLKPVTSNEQQAVARAK